MSDSQSAARTFLSRSMLISIEDSSQTLSMSLQIQLQALLEIGYAPKPNIASPQHWATCNVQPITVIKLILFQP